MNNPVGWFASIFDFLCPRADFPEACLSIDTETTGLGVDSALITQVGWARVHAGRVVSHGEITLDWTRPDYGVCQAWLDEQLERIRAHFARKGLDWTISRETLARDGVDPDEALAVFRDVIAGALADGAWLAGHNVWAFDRPLITGQLRDRGIAPVRFPHDRFIDTGLIEKSRLLKMLPPAPGSDAPCRWYDRVARDGRQVRWGLDNCARTYGLADADPARAHTAGYDCLRVVRLLETMHQLATRGPLGQAQTPQADRDCPFVPARNRPA